MLRLSRLSPARAVNVRCTSPGHANPHFLDRPRFIDPAHPAAKLSLRSLPVFVCPQFTIRAFPNAILHEPEDFVPVNPLLATGLVRARTHTHQQYKWWSNLDVVHTESGPSREGRRRDSFDAIKHLKRTAARRLADAYVAALAKHGRYNISLLFHVSKKATSKSCVVRRRLRSKITAAIDLVVARNTDAVPTPKSGQPRKATPYPPFVLVSRPLQENQSFVLQDWTYLIIPDLAIYKIPLPNLVQVVRKALLSLIQQSKRLEDTWSTLPKRIPRSPSTHLLHKVVDKSQPAIRIRTRHPPHLHRALEHAQDSETPHEPAEPQSTSIRLYSDRPVFLPQDKPNV